MSETLVNVHCGARSPDRYRISRVAAMLRGDAIDYRAMLAREVFKEREWRIGGVSVTPAECALRDLEPANLRTTVEMINGEPLA